MEPLPQMIDLHVHRKDGTVETVAFDCGERRLRELPRWLAGVRGYYPAIYYLIDAEKRRYEERDFAEASDGITESSMD